MGMKLVLSMDGKNGWGMIVNVQNLMQYKDFYLR